MRWRSLAIIGIALLMFGIFFVVVGTSLPVYYAGGGTGISVTGRVVGGLAIALMISDSTAEEFVRTR